MKLKYIGFGGGYTEYPYLDRMFMDSVFENELEE